MTGGLFLIAGLLVNQVLPAPPPVKEMTSVTTPSFIAKSYVWRGAYSQPVAIDFLEQMLQHTVVPVLKLTIYTDEHDAREAERGKGITDISRTTWEEECNIHRKQGKPALELVRIGRRISIRTFDQGSARKLPRLGIASLNIKTEGTAFRFLHLGIEAPRPLVYGASEPTVMLYFLSSVSPDAAAAAELARRLDLPDGNFEVSVSSYSDFIQDGSYPWFNRFAQGFTCRVHQESILATAWCRKSTGKQFVCSNWK